MPTKRDALLALLLLVTAVLVPSTATADDAAYPPPAPPEDTSKFGENYQRTMTLLATSTPERHHKVKILFYGQSITGGTWWNRVADDLRTRFPNADLEITNRAIGGFASQILYRVAEHDVYPYYPDLVIFHVYGAHTCYEDLIATIRRRTAAEVVIWTDHLGAGETLNEAGVYEDQGWTKFMAGFLPATAEKYDCGFIEIREPWKKYLLENHLKPPALLKDGIHPNDHGGYLIAQLLQRQLVYRPDLGFGPSEGLVKEYVVGEDVQWKDGVLELPFDGNRVDLIPAAHTDDRGTDNRNPSDRRAVEVRIDGKRPSEFSGCYAHTRPSTGHGTWGPGAMRVTFQARPLVEDWKVRVTEFDKATKVFRFEAIGSQTGSDGEGVSSEDFVSNSGRVVIKAHVKPPGVPEQTDWRMEGEIPVGYEIRWKTVGMFQDSYEPPVVTDTTREHATTIAQGFPNGKHTVTLTSPPDTTASIRAVRVYRPPLAP
ncbi:MAG TPA: hypothetical protein VE890_14015 [Thermoguttaceae bacterium]|nr:hypothetical protein [Thermoguttaceae bacterium]